MTIQLSEPFGGCDCGAGKVRCDCIPKPLGYYIDMPSKAEPSREQIKPLPGWNMTAGEALAYAVCIVLTIGICMLKAWDWWTP